jgi:cell division protein FtsB
MFALNGLVDGIEKLRAENDELRAENERLEERMKMYEKRAIRLAAENDLLKVSLKQADSKRAAEIINDHFKGGEW